MWSLRCLLMVSLTVLVSAEIFSLDDKFLNRRRDSTSNSFSYGLTDVRGPLNWGLISTICNGNRQSPVNIITTNPSRAVTTPFKIRGYADLPVSIKTTNNGHSIAIKLNYRNNSAVYFEGGPLQGRYIVDNIHWHWGENNMGSEHTINGKKYAAEAHVVSYNSKYGSIEQAFPQPDGLAVLAVFYEYTEGVTNNFFTSFVDNVINYNNFFESNAVIFSLRDLFQDQSWEMYTYQGSLTTPPCYESVTWLLLTQPLKINGADLAKLRMIKDATGNPLKANGRPLQSPNGRSFSLANAQLCYA